MSAKVVRAGSFGADLGKASRRAAPRHEVQVCVGANPLASQGFGPWLSFVFPALERKLEVLA
jgi:hypothetical protein